MQKKTFTTLVLVATMALSATAQGTFNERARAYVTQYKELAMSEQQRSGIPAAITLAQGILETEAGNSELCTIANNHFGIKCKKTWTGETFAHTDDAPNECFRKYTQAIESYKDHSDYLKTNARYQPCFAASVTDYAAWARALKKAGYATNPRYAERLIKLIEDFELQDYTVAAIANKTDVRYAAEVVPSKDASSTTGAPVASMGKYEYKTTATPIIPAAREAESTPDDEPVVDGVTKLNGLKGFYARKGDVLLSKAIHHNVRYAKLLELNDLPDAPLPFDMFIYLEHKHSKGNSVEHVVAPGENLLAIAQSEGIQLRQLRAYNKLDGMEEPEEGAVLQLQHTVAAKPQVHTAVASAPQAAPSERILASAGNDNYVLTDRAKRRAEQAKQEEVVNERPAAVAPTVVKETPAQAPVSRPKAWAATPRKESVNEKPVSEPVVVREPVKKAPVVQNEEPTVNIANETAVEEEPKAVAQTPAPAPVATPSYDANDPLASLKSKLDRAIYTQPGSASKAPATPAKAASAPAPQKMVVAAAPAAQFYTVQKGDTAFGIAKKHGISVKDLRDWNGLDFAAIHEGQKLRVK